MLLSINSIKKNNSKGTKVLFCQQSIFVFVNVHGKKTKIHKSLGRKITEIVQIVFSGPLGSMSCFVFVLNMQYH